MQASAAASQLLLQVPRGFEPEALAEACNVLGVAPDACTSHTHCGLVLCPCGTQGAGAALVAACWLLSLERAYAYLGSIQLDVRQLNNTELDSQERLAGLIAGAADAGRQLAWGQALELWRHCRRAGGKSCDLSNVTFRGSFERFESKFKGLRNQDYAGELGTGAGLYLRDQESTVPKVNLHDPGLDVMGFLLPSINSNSGPSASSTASLGDHSNSSSSGSMTVLVALALPLELLAPAGAPASAPVTGRNRVATGRTALRQTTAYCLARFAGIQAGEVVLDPCCGVASISIEGAMAFPGSYCIGGDVNRSTLVESGHANVVFATNAVSTAPRQEAAAALPPAEELTAAAETSCGLHGGSAAVSVANAAAEATSEVHSIHAHHDTASTTARAFNAEDTAHAVPGSQQTTAQPSTSGSTMAGPAPLKSSPDGQFVQPSVSIRVGRGQPLLDLCRWSAARLPLRPGSVDLVISDLPWGNRELGQTHHSRTILSLRNLYPKLLRETVRVLRPGSGRAVFISAASKLFTTSLEHLKCQLEVIEQRPVIVGGVQAVLYMLRLRC